MEIVASTIIVILLIIGLYLINKLSECKQEILDTKLDKNEWRLKYRVKDSEVGFYKSIVDFNKSEHKDLLDIAEKLENTNILTKKDKERTIKFLKKYE